MKPEGQSYLGRAEPVLHPCAGLSVLVASLLAAPSLGGEWVWQHPLPSGETARAIAAGENSSVAVGDCGTISRFDFKAGTWQPVASPTAEDLRAVAFVSPGTWVAAGTTATILRSSDSGTNWIEVAKGITNETLYGLGFGSRETGIAVGSGGAILRTTDQGKTWSRQDSGVKGALRAITFLGEHEAVAAGESGVILKTEDAGATWKRQQVGEDLFALVSRGDEVIAVGGTVGYFRNSRLIVRSTNRGNGWKVEVKESGPVLYGVSFGPAANALACGQGGLLLERTSPESGWKRANGLTKHLLSCVVSTGDDAMALGSFGVVITSKDGVRNWTANFAEKQKELRSISFADRDRGVAVGGEGMILYTTNGGSCWQRSKSDFKGLSGVHMMNPTTAVGVGSEGLAVRTTDGGESWKAIVAGVDVYLGAVDFIDEKSGIAVGYSTIMATDDGGVTWVRRPLPAGLGDCSLGGVAYASPSVVAAVDFLSAILTSSDGGRTWTRRSSGTQESLLAIAWSDALHGTIVGDKGVILRTEDGGATWAHVPSGTRRMLTGVTYLSAQEGFACGQWGTLLSTVDGGKTWQPERSHTRNHLSSICRAGTAAAAAGEYATILQHIPPSAVSPP